MHHVHRHHLRCLPGHEAFDVPRPALQRRPPLGQQLAFIVDAGDAAAQSDHVRADAEIGEPGDESSPQIAIATPADFPWRRRACSWSSTSRGPAIYPDREYVAYRARDQLHAGDDGTRQRRQRHDMGPQENRTTRVLPDPDNSCAYDTRPLRSCAIRSIAIDYAASSRVWAPAKSARCQPASPSKVDRTDEAALRRRK